MNLGLGVGALAGAAMAAFLAVPAAAQDAAVQGTPLLDELRAQIDPLVSAKQGETAEVLLPPPIPDPVSPDILGSVGVPVRQTRMDGRWHRVIEPASATALARFTGPVATLGRQQQVAFVQGAVNRTVAYRTDIDNWGREDHWATADETLARGSGDCEDFAIVKMQALRQLGFEQRDLYLVIGEDPARGTHAVLLVRLGDRFWVLDDRTNPLVDSARIRNFRPTMTMGSGMAWLYGAELSAHRSAASR
jgi:predicted transglutaminase-like cysteine proteinase